MKGNGVSLRLLIFAEKIFTLVRYSHYWVWVVGVLLSACSGTANPSEPSSARAGKPISVEGGIYTEIGVNDLQAMLLEKDFVLVNVHIPFEGDIPGTDLSIPYDEVTQNLDLLPENKDAKIVLYCRSDRMSEIASKTLVQEGYSNIWNLDGGMVDWERAGFPIEGK